MVDLSVFWRSSLIFGYVLLGGLLILFTPGNLLEAQADFSVSVQSTDFRSVISDWSHQHVVFSRPSPFLEIAEKIRRQPRYQLQELERSSSQWRSGAARDKQGGSGLFPAAQRDWSFDLGRGATAGVGMYPAKYSFDLTTASCGSDFVVFNTSLSGGSGSLPGANIVAFNNLYSGCESAVPAILWGYATGSGRVVTSPVLSLDGSKVAFVETAPSGAILRVLRWQGGQGSFNFATQTWSGAAVDNTALWSWSSCAAAQSCMISLRFSGGAVDMHSSPFYDYANDALYVGDGDGLLHKFIGVFNGTPEEVVAGWPIAVHSETSLTSPAFDSVSGNIFVGDSAGILWYVREVGSSVGACAAGTPPCLGAISVDVGRGSGGPLADGPLVDPSTQKVFAFISCALNGAANCAQAAAFAQVVQASTDLSDVIRANLGEGADSHNLHNGIFDQNYYSGNYSAGHLYACGNGVGNPSAATLYSIGFSSTGVMRTNTITGPALSRPALSQCSPLTEVDNMGVDRIYLSVTHGDAVITPGGQLCSGDCVYAFDVTGGNLSMQTQAAQGLKASGGTSGIIIDNTAGSPTGASQIYFSTLANSPCTTSGGAGGCAVQASQTKLQ